MNLCLNHSNVPWQRGGWWLTRAANDFKQRRNCQLVLLSLGHCYCQMCATARLNGAIWTAVFQKSNASIKNIPGGCKCMSLLLWNSSPHCFLRIKWLGSLCCTMLLRCVPLLIFGRNKMFLFRRAKIINTTLALRSTRYLSKERDYIPWESALGNLQYFILMFDRTEVYGAFEVSNTCTNYCNANRTRVWTHSDICMYV